MPTGVAPQEDELNVCRKKLGGGWLKICGAEPSLYVTVYVVPGGLVEMLLIKNVSVAGIHCKIVDPFDERPTPGFVPLKIEYIVSETHPF